jgi:hypothetical protein
VRLLERIHDEDLAHASAGPPGGSSRTARSACATAPASSAPRRAGYDVVELDGSFAGWLDHQAEKEDEVA